MTRANWTAALTALITISAMSPLRAAAPASLDGAEAARPGLVARIKNRLTQGKREREEQRARFEANEAGFSRLAERFYQETINQTVEVSDARRSQAGTLVDPTTETTAVVRIGLKTYDVRYETPGKSIGGDPDRLEIKERSEKGRLFRFEEHRSDGAGCFDCPSDMSYWTMEIADETGGPFEHSVFFWSNEDNAVLSNLIRPLIKKVDDRAR